MGCVLTTIFVIVGFFVVKNQNGGTPANLSVPNFSNRPIDLQENQVEFNVVDALGKPVEGAKGVVFGYTSVFGGDPNVNSFYTESDGTAKLTVYGQYARIVTVNMDGRSIAGFDETELLSRDSFKKMTLTLKPCKATIAGKVLNSKQQPVKGAIVVAYRGNGHYPRELIDIDPYYPYSTFSKGGDLDNCPRAISDSNGLFHISPLPKGDYVLYAFEEEGHLTCATKKIHLTEESTSDGITCILGDNPQTTIAGRLVDSNNKPLDSLAIRLFDKDGFINYSTFPREGRFTFGGLPQQSYKLSICYYTRPGPPEYAKTFDNVRPGQSQDLKIDCVEVQGIVKMPENKPLPAGAQIDLETEFGEKETISVGSDGKFSIKGLIPQIVMLSMQAPGTRGYGQHIDIAKSENRNLELPLTYTCALTVKVVDEGNKPIPEAEVWEQTNFPGRREQKADSNGIAKFIDYGRDQASIFVGKSGFETAMLEIPLTDGKNNEVEVKLTRKHTQASQTSQTYRQSQRMKKWWRIHATAASN